MYDGDGNASEAQQQQQQAAEEKEPCFVKVAEDESLENFIELPTEKFGGMLLSTLQAQFPNAIGLKYKSPSGSWRGIRLSDNTFAPPFEGWGETVYSITLSKSGELIEQRYNFNFYNFHLISCYFNSLCKT